MAKLRYSRIGSEEGVTLDGATGTPALIVGGPGIVGDGVTDCAAAFAALDASTAVKLVPEGTYRIAADLTLSGGWDFAAGAVLRPDAGVTVTIAASARIHARGDYLSIAAGGAVAYEPSAYESAVRQPVGGGAAPSFNEGHPRNQILASASYVRGGTDAQPHSVGPRSELSLIGGAYDNEIGADATASGIMSGAHHRVEDSASHSAIVGGSYQRARGAYATLGGGTQNRVEGTYGVVVGGHENEAGNPDLPAIDSRAAAVVAGYQNKARGMRAAVVGGWLNEASGAHALVGGGHHNTASGEAATVAGGTTNTASGPSATVPGGESCEASGAASVAAGSSAKASGTYAVALGEFLEATDSYAHATGSRSRARLRGQRAHASGYFATKGDAQISDLVARRQTTGGTQQRLDLFGGTGAPLALPDKTTWLFVARIVARRTDAAGESAAWEVQGCISRDTGAASVRLVGAPTVTPLAADAGAAGWGVAANADTTQGALALTVTPEAGTTIRWVAHVALTEVAG